MRPAAVVASGVALAALAGSSPKVTLHAPTHTPLIGVRWIYTVRATQDGRPLPGRITVQIVDPLGGVHPVQYGTTKTNIVRRRFKGTFRDFVRWPRESIGIPVRFRVTVTTAHVRRVLSYRVTPHA